LVIVKPETLISWHRKGFKLFRKWKSQAGRPRLPENIRKLIVQMAQENPTWGQARVAAELSVKLGIYVSPRTVRAYWPPEPGRRGHRRTSSQNWRTFVRNHAQSIVACDFLVVVRPVSNSLRVPPDGGWDTAHRALQHHRASNCKVQAACGMMVVVTSQKGQAAL
jgi:putative transposase